MRDGRAFSACSNLSVNDTLFDERDLENCFKKVEAIDFHQTVELEGIKFYCHHAGHVLGGSMFNIEIAGVKVRPWRGSRARAPASRGAAGSALTLPWRHPAPFLSHPAQICYTGDYSREEDRHLPAAEVPPSNPDVLICESTYGKQLHEPLPDREARFTRTAQRRRARWRVGAAADSDIGRGY